MFDPQVIRKDFPILETRVSGKPLVYLDNAATSQKPNQVLTAITEYYRHQNANVHRGIHFLSDESTKAFESSRQTISTFFGAKPQELILTRNATEALNGVVYGWAMHNVKEGDVILTTLMEHHANIVPWQQFCQRNNVTLDFVQVTKEGELDLANLQVLLDRYGDKVKAVCFVHVSNTLGTINPVEKIVELVHKAGLNIRIIVDGAQSAPHLPINFAKLGIDFYAFSGHKMLGPMGIGGLLVKQSLLDSNEMQPWLFGGGMIESVQTDKTIFQEDPAERFTAGTPDVASTVGLAAACNYLSKLEMSDVEKYDQQLVAYALEKLAEIKEIKIVGPQTNRLGSVAFIHQGVHAHDVAQVLDSQGVAVRSGHHCCMPLHLHFGWQATVRASFQVYTTEAEIDQLVTALAKVKQVFQL